jgi:prepilin-type N-terminal cleavage/methylation domain-containing protein
MNANRSRIRYVPPGSSSTAINTRIHRRTGISLVETLCVLAILSVIVGFYAWSVMQAFVKVLAFIKTLS